MDAPPPNKKEVAFKGSFVSHLSWIWQGHRHGLGLLRCLRRHRSILFLILITFICMNLPKVVPNPTSGVEPSTFSKGQPGG